MNADSDIEALILGLDDPAPPTPGSDQRLRSRGRAKHLRRRRRAAAGGAFALAVLIVGAGLAATPWEGRRNVVAGRDTTNAPSDAPVQLLVVPRTVNSSQGQFALTVVNSTDGSITIGGGWTRLERSSEDGAWEFVAQLGPSLSGEVDAAGRVERQETADALAGPARVVGPNTSASLGRFQIRELEAGSYQLLLSWSHDGSRGLRDRGTARAEFTVA